MNTPTNAAPNAAAIRAALDANDWPTLRQWSNQQLQVHPEDGNAWLILGLVEKNTGQFAKAEYALRRGILCLPENDDLPLNLSSVWLSGGQWQDALRISQAVWNKSKNPWAALNIAAACVRGAQAEPALSTLRQALDQYPSMPELWVNLASVLTTVDKHAEAMHALEQASLLRPADDTIAFNLALQQLQGEMYAKGFANYERRWGSASFLQVGQKRAALPIPEWEGQDLAGRRLLVISEQGMGDTIQFSRYLLALSAQRPARLVFLCPPALLGLMQASFGEIAEVMPNVTTIHGTIDFALHLMSAPHLLGQRCPVPYDPGPYLKAPATSTQIMADPLRPGQRVRIGLCWQGGRAFSYDYKRSLPVGLVAALAGHLPQVAWYSLQRDGSTWPHESGPDIPHLHDNTHQFDDFAATAAQISQLDLVISVDTAVAHLAAAMGKPCWVLHRHGREWRWLRGRNDSPWYGSARQFEQRESGDWDGVIQQVAAALKIWISEQDSCANKG